MPYWRTFYHVVWTTKCREPLITPEAEAVLYPAIVGKAHELGVIVYALNGPADHVHLVMAIPPRLAVASVVGDIKGRSSRAANRNLSSTFAWQTGYGVLTFGERHLTWVIEYVQSQKIHHAAHTIQSRLEVCQEADDGPPRVIADTNIDGPLDL